MYQKDILKKQISKINGFLKRFFSVCEMKQIITHTKGHHGWKNLNQISNVKEQYGKNQQTKV